MKPWWQVVKPHKDIIEGNFDEAVFAAKLGDVVKKSGATDYLDPNIFFKKTYLTTGLNNLIKNVLLRLSGKSGADSVIQLQTPFGGGKTHALIALYHIAKNGGKITHPNIKNIFKEFELKQTPKIKLAVFVGTEEDALSGRTPWGEIAYQLGDYSIMEKHDKKRIAPGKDNIRKLLEKNQPILILVDELLEYVVKASGEKVGEGTLKGQTIAFFQELTEVVSTLENSVLVITLPSSAPERYDEAGELAFLQLQKIFGRIEKIYELVEGGEYYEIIRKRLFENLGDEEVHNLIAKRYLEIYRGIGEDMPSFARESQYGEKIKKAYPFHPEVIDILFERWGTIQSFQRTRGVLRLLAMIVGDLYNKRDASLLIQPTKIDLSNSSIRGEFIKHIGNPFEGVIRSDIFEKAQRIDKEMGTEYQKYRVATALSTSIFFYSFSGAEEKKGVSLPQLRLSFLEEGIPSVIVGDAIKRLEEELWYLYEEKSLYYFSAEVNLNKAIIDREDRIKDQEIEETFRNILQKIAGEEFSIFLWPESSADIPDTGKLKLVILPPKYPHKTSQTESFINELITKHSSGFRTYKNTIIVLLIDGNEYEATKLLIKRYLALQSIKADRSVVKNLSEGNKRALDEKIKKVEPLVPFKIFSAYRHIAKTESDGVKFYDLGIPTVGETLNLSKRVKEYLKEEELLLDKISPLVLLDKTFAKTDQERSIAEVKGAFVKFPGLPIIENEGVIVDAILKGINDGTFGVKEGERVYYREPIFGVTFSDDAVILRPDIARIEKQKMEGEVRRETVGIPRKIEEEKEKPSITITPEHVITKRVRIKARISWDKLSDIVSGVIKPLKNEGADIQLELEITADSEKGISKNTLQLKIKETLNQINAEIIDWEEA